ncbi:MAG: hypothetical protein JWN98_2101 [Abditibacteriota bacterium]|nr:hypothetical protein [Abditibacteriota bacterium]
MKHTSTWTKWLGIGAITLVAASGCADRNKNGQPDSVATGGEMDNAAGKTGDVVANVANKAEGLAETAAKVIAKEGKNVDDAIVITPKVKAALAANPSIRAMAIDVSTTDKNVTLDGTVQNAAQKTAAGMIAKKNAPGYKIINNLKVAGGASAKMKKG